MKKYEQKINELGLGDNLSKNIKSLIKDFNDAESDLEELREKVEEAEGDEKARIEGDIEELERILEQGDEEITRKVEQYFKNKDVYDARMQKMKEGREASKAAKLKAQGTTKAKADEPAPAPAPAPMPEPAPSGQTIISKAGGGETQVITPEVVEEKEESGFGSLLLMGVLGVAGIFIGINLFKNRN